jgi:dUTP pyrophosphatase
MVKPSEITKPPEGAKVADFIIPRPSLQFVKLHEQAQLPFRAYNESAGYDLSACLISDLGRPNTLIIPPRMTRTVSTGLALRPPPGHLILICSRSGMAQKSVFVSNAPGVVDPDYTGEIKVLLFNGGTESFYVKHEDRIAQALVIPFAALPLQEASSFAETERGNRGFGSSG